MNVMDLDTPALLVDLDRLEANIARMQTLADRGGKRLRPHSKTHKTPEVARRQMAAGARGITVAKLGEAEAMADAGIEDIFIANQVVGAAKVERLLALAGRTPVTVGVDSVAGAAPISEACARAGFRLPVMLEVDTGMGRAGVRTVEEAVALGALLAGMPGLELAGIFTHEGIVYRPDAAARTEAAAAAAAMMRHAAAALRATGIAVPVVSVGSTPGAAQMAREPGIDEMRPGVYIFGDVMQVGLGAGSDTCALSVLTTVTSRPEPNVAITDAGTKAMSGDRGVEGSIHGVVQEDAGIVFSRASEEHGRLDITGSLLTPVVGSKLRVTPWHACACTNMHETIVAVRGDRVEETWTIAGRGQFR